MQQSSTQTILSLTTLALLSTITLAQDSGAWTQSAASPVVTSAAKATSAAAPVDWNTVVTWPAGCESWANPCPAGAKTSGVAPTPAVITWPAGCQDWANPCPASAIISGGSVAATSAPVSGYTNGFTSYTTMTNSNGVITGMPPKATVAGGASSVLSAQSSWMSAYGSSATTLATVSIPSSMEVVHPSSTVSGSPSATGFFQTTGSASATSAPYTGAASSTQISFFAAAFAGLIALLS